MAKIHGFTCDRCGQFYDKNRRKNPKDKTGYNVVGMAFVNTAKQLNRYDLCDTCIEELQEWMARPEAYVVGEDAKPVITDDYAIPDEVRTDSEE